MYLSEFWSKFGIDILVSSIFILAGIVLLVVLIINSGHKGTSKKMFLIGGTILVLALLSMNLILIKDYNAKIVEDPTFIFPLARVLLFNAFVILAFVGIGYLLTVKSEKVHEKVSVSTVAILGLLIALASVLMLFGIPIFPNDPYLKLEVSALIYFMVLLWFGIKPTIIVIFLTNIIHAIMPSITPPLIPFLDEMVNVIAVFAFLLPSFIAFRKLQKDEIPSLKKVIFTSVIGVLFTTVFMVLYNYFVNLPLIYGMEWSFSEVLAVFGSFNLIKWGAVSIVVPLLYRKIYTIKNQIIR